MTKLIAVTGTVILAASIGALIWKQSIKSIDPNRPTAIIMSPDIEADKAATAALNALIPIHKMQKAAFANRDYYQLETLCNQGIALYSAEPFSWLYLAEAEEHLGKTNEELKAYRELIYPNGWGSSINSDPTTHMKYVLALLRNNNWEEAVKVYTKAMPEGARVFSFNISERGFDSGRREFKRMQGMAHLYLGSHSPGYRPDRPGEILGHLQEAIKLQPGLALAHYAYGRQLEEENRPVEAKAAFQRALRFGDGDLKSKIKIQMSHM